MSKQSAKVLICFKKQKFFAQNFWQCAIFLYFSSMKQKNRWFDCGFQLANLSITLKNL